MRLINASDFPQFDPDLYQNWDTNGDDTSNGYCVEEYTRNGFNFVWRTEQCAAVHKLPLELLLQVDQNYLCQVEACSTDKYCEFVIPQ